MFLGWSLGDELNEVAAIDIEREKWKPKIGLQGVFLTKSKWIK